MKQVLTLIFGQRAKGEPVPEPTFKTTYPDHRPDETKWAKDYNFGSRYGHRGSFYNRPSNVMVLNKF